MLGRDPPLKGEGFLLMLGTRTSSTLKKCWGILDKTLPLTGFLIFFKSSICRSFLNVFIVSTFSIRSIIEVSSLP